MRILGIDPGYAIVGFGVIDMDNRRMCKVVDYGAITTHKDTPFPERLEIIGKSLAKISFSPSWTPDIILFLFKFSIYFVSIFPRQQFYLKLNQPPFQLPRQLSFCFRCQSPTAQNLQGLYFYLCLFLL